MKKQGGQENSEASGNSQTRPPLRAKREDNSRGLDTNFGKLLLDYPDLIGLGDMRPKGDVPSLSKSPKNHST